MFFEGTLQEAVATAIQQARPLVCFVTDNEDESKQWENEFLTHEDLASPLQATIVIRLKAGTVEAGYLEQIYPVPKKPTVVIMKGAELKGYIAAGVTKDDFVKRMKTALGQPVQPGPASPLPAQSAPATTASTTTSSAPAPSSTASSSNSGQVTPPSPAAESVAARLAAQQRQQEEEARRLAEAKKEAGGTANTEQNKHVETLRKKQQEAREERQRILKAIEDDKAARRARQAEAEAERKRAAAAAQEGGDGSSIERRNSTTARPSTGQSSRTSEHCALQVRLFDGSTIRNRFSSTGDTLKEVREWVDKSIAEAEAAAASAEGRKTKTAANIPYTFKVLLTPLPSKNIDETEEDKSLRELDLAPSSTLILVPVRTHKRVAAAYRRRRSSASVSAYTAELAASVRNGNGNAFTRFLVYILSCITGFFRVIVDFFSTLFSTQGLPESQQQQQPGQASESSSSAATASGRSLGGAGEGSRIKGFDTARDSEDAAARRRRNEQQFYNGNSTNFEPRHDDEEE